MSIRDTLNISDPNRNDDALREVALGDLINLVLKTQTATDAGLATTANVITLTAQPSTVWDINATAGTTTGRKKLRKGPITGPQKITPATGEAVWDGGLKVLFATVDAVTTASALYSKTSDTTASILQRNVGDGVG